MKDLRTIWKHRWLTQKARVRDSKIHGLGTVAIKPLVRGELVCVFGGIVVPSSEILKYREKMGHVGIQVDDKFFICPTSRREIEQNGTFNHSCEPNVGCLDSIIYIAIKDINPGEELTADMAFTESLFEPFECKCGSSNCRRIIKPTDWKIPKLQKKYRQFFSPYLKRKFRPV